MSLTMVCLQLTRTLIILLTASFIVLSLMQLLDVALVSWPTYPRVVGILLDLVLFIGLIAALVQHLKMLIFFSWLVALTFLLIFFGNTVSSQYQSDLPGMFFLLFVCVLAFTDAVCIIKYRMPCEEAHHPFTKCSQQQLFDQAESLPIPPPPHLLPQQHHAHHQTVAPTPMMASPTSSLPPTLNSHCYVPKSDPQFHAL